VARTTATNFSGALQFPYATASTDLFKKEDIQTLAQAVDQHNHSVGKGLALPAGLITSGMIADGTIATVDIAAAAITQALLAKPSVSTPELIDAGVTAAKIAGHAVSRVFTQSFAAAISTTSASFVSSGDTINWTPVSAACDILVVFQGTYANTVAGAIGQFYASWAGGNIGGPLLKSEPVANGLFSVTIIGYASPSTHGGVLGSVGLYWNTNTGTLSSSWTRNLFVLELNK
jgi:hypothetical protein